MEDYKEKIKKAIDVAEENLINDRKKRDEAQDIYDRRQKEEEAPIKRLIEEYLDYELKDMNGTSIRKGYLIAHKSGFPAYKVINRGMPFLLGMPIFSPSVEVLKYSALEKAIVGKKSKRLSKSDLKEIIIVSID